MAVHVDVTISIIGDGGVAAALIIASATALDFLSRAAERFANARLMWIRGTIIRNAENERCSENGRDALDSSTNAERAALPRIGPGTRDEHIPPWARVCRRVTKELRRDGESD